MRSEIFPIGMKLEGRLCLVVGDGEEAERRSRAFVDAGAMVRVVSERPSDALVQFAESGVVALHRRPFTAGDLDGVWLAVYTDMEPGMATRIAEAAEARRVFYCAVDLPAQSSYSHLALSKTGPVTVAVSTDGRAPALARRLRDELARVFAEARLAEFAEQLAELRDRTKSAERREALGRAVSEVRFEGRLLLSNDEASGRAGGRRSPGS